MLSPALRIIAPLPPDAVILALIVRSSAAMLPLAESVMSPPPEFNTASSIVSGLAAEMLMTPPLVETPVMPPIPPIVNPPVFAT